MDLQEMVWVIELDSSGSEQGQVAGCCKCDNEIKGSIKCARNFLTR
jgi:hypothetical protein